MKRGIFEPRSVVNDCLTNNEQKVLDASYYASTTGGKIPRISEIVKKTGLSRVTVMRHLGTIEKWLDEEV